MIQRIALDIVNKRLCEMVAINQKQLSMHNFKCQTGNPAEDSEV